jgi:hypothetical protein
MMQKTPIQISQLISGSYCSLFQLTRLLILLIIISVDTNKDKKSNII